MIGSRCPMYSPLLNMICFWCNLTWEYSQMFSLLCCVYRVWCWYLDPSLVLNLVADKMCHMSFNCVAFDFDWNDVIMSRWYFESWCDNSYSCLLFTVSSKSEKSAILLYVADLFLIPGIWQGKFFWISIPNSTSVSGSLSHIMQFWVNLKSAILRWSAVIPYVATGDPSAVFNLVVVACIDVLKLLSIVWSVEYLVRDMAAPESIRVF